ncbi:MAG TPA: hypothetical protein VHO25_22220 [Polyangiaceae bacterium]|nr:hypothetical protein [Polyangiaceae bacterium]
MTYVVAAKRFGQTAIIADMGVTWRKDRAVSNVAVKTGILFNGCAYGISGAAEAAYSVLKDFKLGIPDNQDPAKTWRNFVGFLERRAPSTSAERFQLVLSSRHSGTPELLTFDSMRPALVAIDHLVTLGAGRDFLDMPLQEADQDLLTQTIALLSGHGALDLWPAVYCLWLSQYSSSQDYDLREAHKKCGVAGLYHYITQDADGEWHQPPSVYTLVTSSPTKLVAETYRVARNAHAVTVDSPIEDAVLACVDPLSTVAMIIDGPDVSKLNQESRQAIGDSAEFFGLGFADPKYFDKIAFQIPGDGPPPVRISDGFMHESMPLLISKALGIPIPRTPSETERGVLLEQHRSERKLH